MALIMSNPAVSYDLTQIRRGDLIWGRHRTWNEGKAGFVTAATEDCIIIQYCASIRNVTNHFAIPVAEVADGQWEIRWSADMTEIQEYIINADKEQEKEGGDGDDAGGTDL
ncbi:MAG: DUF5026 domain-containing protein [Clostridium sp.]|nr:DUF5026 domain-containing protein [Clostridium sp.]